MSKKIQVGDGSVQLISYTRRGDLAVTNAARASFGKIKTRMDSSDVDLIRYLAKHKHMSPFRHVHFSFLIETSEVVCRQLYKHQVGCGFTSGEFRESATTWNEQSGRYVTLEEKFHRPTAFRSQHDTNRQASTEDLIEAQSEAKDIYEKSISNSYEAYQRLLELGVCREQARMVVPISFMNSFVWTASLEAVVNFIKLRDHDGAQKEIRELAIAIGGIVGPLCPVSIDALRGEVK